MNKSIIFASAAMIVGFTACDSSVQNSTERSEKGGGVTVALRGADLSNSVGAKDSISLELLNGKDTIHLVKPYSETYDCNGLDDGIWKVKVIVFKSDSGYRKIFWKGTSEVVVGDGDIVPVDIAMDESEGDLDCYGKEVPPEVKPVVIAPEKPVFEKTVVIAPEKPVVEKPVVVAPEKPIVEKPVVVAPEKPVVEKPVVVAPEKPVSSK